MECLACGFKCAKPSNFERHKSTAKHAGRTKALVCPECAKVYKTPSGLWKHTRQCKQPVDIVLRVLEANKDLRALLLQQQDDSAKKQEVLLTQLQAQQQQINELIPRIGNTTNRFNLTVFLNEECKDAVNWDDFIESLQLQLDGGYMKTICDGIQELGVHRRPIHCVDLKRKKLCLKTADVWEHNHAKVQEQIKKSTGVLQQRYLHVLKSWEEAHPEWYTNEAESEEYTHFVAAMVGEMDDERCAAEISKNVCLPKA